MTEEPFTVPKVELLLLLEELLLTITREIFSDAAVCLSLLLAGEEEEEEEEGKEDAFVTEGEEEEALDDEEELLVQAALDSSPKGFPNAGAGSSTVSARTVGTDDKAACFLWPTLCVCGPSLVSGPLGMPFRSLLLASPGLHSAPTSTQAPVPVIIPVSAKTLPPGPARTPASVSAQTAVLAPVNTFPSDQVLGPRPRSLSVPSITSWSLTSALFPAPGVAERLEGSAGFKSKTARLIDSW